MTDRGNEAAELCAFGLEREMSYSGHLTPASQIVPLPKRTFASADETHIRVWGPSGDLAKMTFPSNRRSMISAMAFCPGFSTLITGEVDMTMKCYSLDHLELIESFTLEQARSKFKEESKGLKAKSSGKVCSLAWLPGNLILAGSECGCELWHLAKSNSRRTTTGSSRGLEFRLGLDLKKQVTTEPVHRIIALLSEQRVVVCGKETVEVFDLELTPLASCKRPLACSACIHQVSNNLASLLTGAADGSVSFWSIQGRASDDSKQTVAWARLEHAFHGHTRAVEMVSFYHRLERDVQQRLAVSAGLDGKLQVWNLESLSLVYCLDIDHCDSKAHVFPLSPHLFAMSYSLAGGGGGDGRQSASVSLIRFSAQIATPFATTNGSPVVQIVQGPHERLRPALAEAAKENQRHHHHSPSKEAHEHHHRQDDQAETPSSVVLISEDMAIRVVSSDNGHLLSTLPPPPNSKVTILQSFLCPVWQLLILWLSSEELAVFFVPSGAKLQDKNQKGARNAATPLLLRRFSIVEIRTVMLDKDLSREAFQSVSLYHGPPLPPGDALLHGLSNNNTNNNNNNNSADLGRDVKPDWFLVVGTKLGTVQAFRLCDILSDLPIWTRLASHLPAGAWNPQAAPPPPSRPVELIPASVLPKAPARLAKLQTVMMRGEIRDTEEDEELEQKLKEADERMKQIEQEHLAAMELSRAPGQRPFPREAPPLRVYSRWRCHDYAIKVVESAADRILTIDQKRNLKVTRATDAKCIFRFQLGEYLCQTLCLQPSAGGASEVPAVAGLALGNAKGSLELLLLSGGSLEGGSGAEPELVYSNQSHTAAVIQVDYLPSRGLFASVGQDNTFKLWSSRLVLLKDITFPSTLSSVAFMRHPQIDTSKGHGDILLGFAAHVELVKVEFWARGLDEEDLLEHGGSPGGGLAIGDKGDDLLSLGSRAGDNLEAQFAQLQSGQRGPASKEPQERKTAALGPQGEIADSSAADRLRNGAVMDFRGPAVVRIGTLSGGRAVDMVGLELLRNKPSEDSCMEHEHTQVLDQGDFRAIMRQRPAYYDWTVNPSSMVDAPRCHAIRGVAGEGNVAVVTSVGVGHLREGQKAKQKVGQSKVAEPKHDAMAEESEEGEEPEQLEEQEAQPPLAPRRPEGRPPSAARGRPYGGRPVNQESGSPQSSPSQLPPLRGGGKETQTVEGKTKKQETSEFQAEGGEDSAEREFFEGGENDSETEERYQKEAALEAWRNKRIARGVPLHADAPRPMAQHVANSDADVAKMLKTRGVLSEAPDDGSQNKLARIGAQAKKADWLYCGADHNLGTARRKGMELGNSADKVRSVLSWTPTGRFMGGADLNPPQKALPSSYMPLPPEHLRMRPPVTRSEVTELRIIQAISQGPPSLHQKEELALESQEFFEFRQEQVRQLRAAHKVRRSSDASAYGWEEQSGSSSPTSWRGVVFDSKESSTSPGRKGSQSAR